MADFTISEDFPKNEIEFDKRFSNPQSCYDYLLNFRDSLRTGSAYFGLFRWKRLQRP